MSKSGRLNPSSKLYAQARAQTGRLRYGLCLSLGSLMALGALSACDIGLETGARAQAEEAKVLRPDSLESGESSNANAQRGARSHRAKVRVDVAGTQVCRACDRDQVARTLGVRARKEFAKDPLSLPEELLGLRAEMSRVAKKFRWTLKFRDELRVRPDLQRKSSGPAFMKARGHALGGLETLQQKYGLAFVSQVQMSEAELEAVAIRAMRKSLNAQPDLGGLYWVDAQYNSPEEMLEVGRALQALDSVEFVELERLGTPPPGDIPPKTDDLSSYQTYLNAKIGVNALWAWEQGVKGKGVRVSDCEFSWHKGHEEFTDNPLSVEKGQTLGNQYPNHGTAVMGILMAPHNGFGMNGIAPEVEPWVYPEVPNRRVASVTNAIKDSEPGDIVMLEMQIRGPGGGDGPAELNKQVWMATKAGTDGGVVVIGAAGNGSQNLDSSAYSSYRSWGDSGLIMVGAGTPDGNHSSLGFSTYGKRVDVHGWGRSVAATGYGALKKYGGDVNQQYTQGFSGTSSATPIVVGVASLVQSYAIAKLGKPLTPKEMRDVLKKTGTKQGSGRPIGPLPNAKAAIESFGDVKADEEAPDVEITKPSDEVSEPLEEGDDTYKLRVEVEAKDNTKVKEVYLEVDGDKVGEADDEEPYVFDVELEAGKYKIRAIAVDLAGNEGQSDTLKVKIKGDEAGDDTESTDTENSSDNTEPSDGEDQDTKSDTEDTKEDSDTDDNDSEDAGDSDGDDSGTAPSAKDPGGGANGGCGCRSSSESSALLGSAWLVFGIASLGARRRRRSKA